MGNYAHASGTNTPGATVGQAGVEVNYGAASNLQVSLNLPVAYASSPGLRAGVGDLEAGLKYRFLHPTDDSWLPDVAAFPAVTAPTGTHGFSSGHATLFMPIWLEKDFDKWSIFGGGGYDVNPGAGQRNYTLAGLAVTRSLGKHLNFGIEIYHQTPTSFGATALTNLGLGGIYQMTQHWAVMASGGPGLQRPSRSGFSNFYISLQFTN